MVSNGNAGSRSLCVVDEDIDTAEGINSLFYNIFYDCFVVLTFRYISLDSQNFDAVFAFQFFFCVSQFFYITAGDYQIATFFCVSSSDTVADGAASAVRQNRVASAGDDSSFTS